MSTGGFARDWKFWILAALSALCALVAAANIFLLGAQVRERQTNVASRQQFISETIPLAQVNSQIIQALANLSAESGDLDIRDMLARHGVTFSVNQPALIEEPPAE